MDTANSHGGIDNSQDFDSLFRNAFNAVEHLRALQRMNTELSAALEQANTKLASSESVFAERISGLEQRSHQLASELEQARKQFISLQRTFNGTVADLEAKNQHLTENAETSNRRLALYEGLHEGLRDLLEKYRAFEGDKEQARQDDDIGQESEAFSERLRQDVEEMPWRHGQPATPQADRDVEGFTVDVDALEDALQREYRALKSDLMRSAGNSSQQPETEYEDRREHLQARLVREEEIIPQPSHAGAGLETKSSPNGDVEIELVVSPFAYFDTINRFVAAIRSLPGVTSARARRFQKGTLYLWLEYGGIIPLADRFREITDFDLIVIKADPRRIQATLQPLKDSAAVDATGNAQLRR